MRSLSSSIIVLAGAVAFAGASASRGGGSIDAVGGTGGILIALIGLITWLITLDPPERKP